MKKTIRIEMQSDGRRAIYYGDTLIGIARDFQEQENMIKAFKKGAKL